MDENRIAGEKKIKDIKEKLISMLTVHFEDTEGETWCKCDVCTLIRLKAIDKEIINDLAYVGLEYLLNENFNGAAALFFDYETKR